MSITVQLDGQPVVLDQPTKILELLFDQGKTLFEPTTPETEWINNPSCPLVHLIEVNEQIVPIAVWWNRPVADGMVIQTRSEQLDTLLAERLAMLHDSQQCKLMADLQQFATVEAISSGILDPETRAGWQFESRGSSPSIFHDPNACIRCQACVDKCNETQEVGALSFDKELGVLFEETKCTRCGQCVLVCPTGVPQMAEFMNRVMGCEMCPYSRPLGAMREVDDTRRVWDVLKDPEKCVVVQFAPAVRATVGEAFGLPAGTLVTGKLYAALRRMGFDQVWDTNFTADLTIMEEGYELLDRLNNGGTLPQFTSCSPGWIRYCETFYPDLIPNISSAKSPQQMFGAVAKTYGAEQLEIDPRKMVVVSIMPCTAKKSEAGRDEMNSAYHYWLEKGTLDKEDRFQDVDIVLTSREAAKLLKMGKIDLAAMPEEKPDPLLSQYTGAAPIFGRTGGVMEAALRTAYEVVTNTPLEKLEFEDLGTLDGIKAATVPVDGIEVKVAVAHGLGNARKICDSVRDGGEFASYHFIEFMACEGGCIGGGGQIIPTNTVTRNARIEAVNRDDQEQPLRKSHENPEVEKIYGDFLEKPLGHLSHHLLHTSYTKRTANGATSAVTETVD